MVTPHDEAADHDAALIARMQTVIRGLLPRAIWPRHEPPNVHEQAISAEAQQMVAAWDRYDAEMARREGR